jgi:serine protease
MRTKRISAAVALAVLLASGASPAVSATNATDIDPVSGIIVQYSQGVDPIAKNGEPTGANLLRGPISSEDLGGGLYALSFPRGIAKDTVRGWVKRMVLDRRISWAELNLRVEQTSVTASKLLVQPLEVAKPASAPRLLRARASVDSSDPDQARIRLSWMAPAKRFGAQVVGYQILYSSNGGQSFQTLIRDTGSDETRVFVSDGIRAGVSYRFRVRAITNDGSRVNTVGATSTTASALVRTAPKPVYIKSKSRIGPGTVNYREQSLSERGGFAKSQLSYRAIATAIDSDSVETVLCNATRCRFPDLLPDTTYSVEVLASNRLGESSSTEVATVSDFYFPLQWFLNGQFGISIPGAWNYAKGDNSKVVAVIDTGIKEHEQISDSLLRNPDGTIYGHDFVSNLESAGDGDSQDRNPNDEGGNDEGGSSYHGTFVAGLIAARHDELGISGVAPGVKILPIRALGRDGGTVADLVKAVNWAAGVKINGVRSNRHPVSVINLSLGAIESVSCSGGLASVFATAISRGITVVAAAGNEGRASLTFPANCKGVLAVVASQPLGDRASYSNFGSGAFISAPGGEEVIGSTEAPDARGRILSTGFTSTGTEDYVLAEGTSMAAPLVSGVVALMYAMQPNITPAKVRSILSNSVKRFAPGSTCATSGGCGRGILNAHLALARTSLLE